MVFNGGYGKAYMQRTLGGWNLDPMEMEVEPEMVAKGGAFLFLEFGAEEVDNSIYRYEFQTSFCGKLGVGICWNKTSGTNNPSDDFHMSPDADDSLTLSIGPNIGFGYDQKVTETALVSEGFEGERENIANNND